ESPSAELDWRIYLAATEEGRWCALRPTDELCMSWDEWIATHKPPDLYTTSLDAALTLVPDEAFVFNLSWDDEPVSHPIFAGIITGRSETVARLERPQEIDGRVPWKAALARLVTAAALRALAEEAEHKPM